MKIYTRTGDKGSTSLIGGKRVLKDDPQIEAYGTIDELLSWVSLLREQEELVGKKDFLLSVLDRLMTCSAIVANDPENNNKKLPQIKESDILALEDEIDDMESGLDALNSFLIPGGHPVISYCHITRTVCRRAERAVLRIKLPFPEAEAVNKYLNRLSDLLFVLSRHISVIVGADETPWKPGI